MPPLSPFHDQVRLSGHQRTLLGLVGVGSMLEFWDAYLIGFIMAILAKPWGLSYGVMGVVLLASGAGAVLGGAVWGMAGDRFGRKPVMVVSLLVLAAASLGLAFTPAGNWIYMAALRTVIGFCTGGFFVQISLVHEFIPPRRRGMLTGVVSAITTGGLLLGAFSGAYVIPVIGWRWTFALGAVPAVVGLLGAAFIPESARWLSLHGRDAAARASVAWALGEPEYHGGLDVPERGTGRWPEIFRYPRNVLTTTLVNLGLMTGYYGIVLWAPTLLAQVGGVTPAAAAKVMIVFAMLGMASRLIAARLADRIGRRKVGGCLALGAAVATVLAGLAGHGDLGSATLFWLPLLLAFVLADGGFSVCALYSTEVWPSRLRGSGSGFGGLTGSVGKMLGPIGLAVVVGSGNIVGPAATASALVPAFAFLAVCLLICGLTYLTIGIEARGRSLEAIDQGFERPAAGAGAKARLEETR
ncbi:MAG TPA: MFS transporter [Streptosporangiaceae bacterium]|jgi:putative MFS transporter